MGIQLKRRIVRWISNFLQEGNYAKCIESSGTVAMKSNNTLDSRGMTLKIFPGLGGLAIETYQYDSRTGDGHTTLHIIPDGEELSEALSRIVTLDTMRMR